MKYYVLFLIALCSFTEFFAESVSISSPINGHTYSIPTGQSTMSITVSWTYVTDSSDVWFTLYSDAGTTNNVTSPTTINNVQPGSKSWRLQMNYKAGGFATTIVNFSVVSTPIITVDNNFTDTTGITHGVVMVSGFSGNQTAPLEFPRSVGANVTLTAVSNQKDSEGLKRIWYDGKSNWTRNYLSYRETQQIQFNVAAEDNGVTFTAHLSKVFNASFGSEKQGPLDFYGITYIGTTPNIEVVEGNNITCYAVEFEENNILFITDYWDYGTYNPNTNTVTWSPTSTNQVNTVHYKGRPIPYDRNLHFNSYDPLHPTTRVKLYWNVYPNSDVKYQIWRKVYQNDILINTAKLATLNNSITTYTDYDYYIRPAGEGDVDLSYDVRPVYTPSGVAQDENFVGWLHGDNANMSKEYVSNEIEKVEDYSLSNYPNPFNPKTTIEYQLPKAGEVTLKVYNALGKEVANLVNDFKREGRHTVDFDGSSLASGIYYCEFRVNDFTSIKKMLMIK